MPDQVSATFSSLALALGAKYEVKRLVGSGGFADVYEVWDKDLERRLAVKVLRPDVAWTSGMIERFQRETRAAAKLEHPNILPIHFVGGGEGLVYYAMPFVDGMSLGELLKRSGGGGGGGGGALPAERALAIIIPILDALDHAHKAGLLHRDIKPDNIMLDVARGRPLLVDFGIARRLDSEAGAGLTQTGLVIGTPHYMSPEQALGDPNLGPASDLYSLGCVLFQMVTGAPPFDGESSQQVVGKHIADPPPAAHAVNPSVPRELSDVILRCLAKQPKDRYRSAAEVITALEKQPGTMRSRTTAAQAATELLVSGATKVTARRPVGRSAGRRRILLVAGVILAVLGLGASAFFLLEPKPTFENALADTVTVQAGQVTWRIPPGEKISLEPGSITWRVVRPRAGSRELGLPLGQMLTVRRGTVRATPQPGTQAYFEPLITNETGRPITITVNAGLAGAVACNCTVPAGAVRMPIGFYLLFQNSTVRAEDPGTGATATFRDLGLQVDRTRGTVALKFRAGDLRPTR
ncbi:MAG TPA: serine/threonine-protein kinase [Gemmatimonadales bacterium]|nr:serine/threonine-protein kinase [Gemmatimonadales bacterium]